MIPQSAAALQGRYRFLKKRIGGGCPPDGYERTLGRRNIWTLRKIHARRNRQMTQEAVQAQRLQKAA